MTKHAGMDRYVEEFLNTNKAERAGFLAGLSAAKLIVHNCQWDLDIADIVCQISEHQQFFEELYWNRPERG